MSTSNPLYGGRFNSHHVFDKTSGPPPKENLSTPPQSNTGKTKGKEKYALPSFFQELPLIAHLRRVDHFVGYGATMVTRKLMEEIIADYQLPPVVASRAFPRPFDYVEPGTQFPLNDTDENSDGRFKINKNIKYQQYLDFRRKAKQPKESESIIEGIVNDNNFRIMVSLNLCLCMA